MDEARLVKSSIPSSSAPLAAGRRAGLSQLRVKRASAVDLSTRAKSLARESGQKVRDLFKRGSVDSKQEKRTASDGREVYSGPPMSDVCLSLRPRNRAPAVSGMHGLPLFDEDFLKGTVNRARHLLQDSAELSVERREELLNLGSSLGEAVRMVNDSNRAARDAIKGLLEAESARLRALKLVGEKSKEMERLEGRHQ